MDKDSYSKPNTRQGLTNPANAVNQAFAQYNGKLKFNTTFNCKHIRICAQIPSLAGHGRPRALRLPSTVA